MIRGMDVSEYISSTKLIGLDRETLREFLFFLGFSGAEAMAYEIYDEIVHDNRPPIAVAVSRAIYV